MPESPFSLLVCYFCNSTESHLQVPNFQTSLKEFPKLTPHLDMLICSSQKWQHLCNGFSSASVWLMEAKNAVWWLASLKGRFHKIMKITDKLLNIQYSLWPVLRVFSRLLISELLKERSKNALIILQTHFNLWYWQTVRNCQHDLWINTSYWVRGLYCKLWTNFFYHWFKRGKNKDF